MQLEVGSIIEGKVTGVTKFGAFVQINGGQTGLVHISEIATDYVKDINDHIKLNDKVKAKVVSIVPGGKISLSIKQVLEQEKEKRSSRPADVEMFKSKSSDKLSFDDMMNKFKLDSDEKMQTLRRSFESKRGFNGKRK